MLSLFHPAKIMIFPELFYSDTCTDFQVSIDLPAVPVVSKQRPDAQV